MAEPKTKPTGKSVDKFINSIKEDGRREDCFAVARLMEEVTGFKPQMWGESIVGFDSYHYKYASGQEADWPVTGFSPRKQNLTLYIMTGAEKQHELLKKLGKHTSTNSCLYLKRLDDIHLPTRKKLVRESVKITKKRHPSS